jgi:amino acid adenylation domain-containing protein
MITRAEPREEETLYWSDVLTGAPTKLEFPSDRPRPSMQSLRQSTESFVLPNALVQTLCTLAEQEQGTLHMVLGAGFLALLQRYTGQDDILVGSPVLRRAPGNGDLSVVNTVILRARFTDHVPFRSLFQQVCDWTLGAHAHADTQFESLVSQYAPERDPSHAPICQVMFNFAEPQEDADQRWIETRSVQSEIARYDLALLVFETANGLEGSLAYSSDLFEPETMRRLCAHYCVMLEAIANDPDQDASVLPMLTETERRRILEDWNDTRINYPAICAPQLFEQQAAAHPDATALICGERQLSYRELNQRANQVAHHLRKRGIGPDMLAAVCLDRSPELVIALLGVWKAGGAYVPLDPTNPTERLQYMLRDAATKTLLTNSRQRHLFSDSSVTAICIDSDWPMLAEESTDNLDVPVGPDHLAYVMYTSGSTGKPKGAMIVHRGLANYLHWAANEYAAGSGESVPVHSSIAFDLTVTALWVPLIAGGQVELLAEDVSGPSLFVALRSLKGRSLVKITPAHLSLLAEQLRSDEFSDRTRLFVIGGENLSADSLQPWRDHAPATRLINEYGPTETVVGCCIYEVQAGDPSSGSIPIGSPIANTQLYVLDRLMNPVPWGVAGELYIGGAGVARGYWNRPDLTKEKFLADPFSHDSGGRLYKSGDIARYRADGILEYLGRVDDQVKVRGYRIELGEIEAKLAEHPGVKACAVLVREVTPGSKHLVGYVVLYEQDRSTAEDIRSALRAELPEYMLPSRFVFLDVMPLTSNGKVDRRALPVPSNERAADAEHHNAGRSEVEMKLVEIWRDLLGVNQIGVDDNFFELGGSSLLTIRVVSRIRDVFAVDLSPQAVIDDQTIATLARVVESAGRTQGGQARMIPYVFGESRLYGAYHEPHAPVATDTALLVCPPIGHEHTRAHRAVMLLCEAAARTGIATLRFDYSGVGDSAGEFALQTVDVWCTDVLKAADELLSKSGVRSIHIVGCRLGAAIAAASLRREARPVQAICLWDPIFTGTEFLRLAGAFQENFLQDRNRFSGRVMRARAAKTGGVIDDSCLGYSFPAALRRSLENLDLRQAEAWPTVPIHVVVSERSASNVDLVARVASSGRNIQSELVEGAPGDWNNYEVHERTLRAGPLISRIVDLLRLKEGHS